MDSGYLLEKRGFVAESTEAIYHLQLYIVASVTILYYDHLIMFPTERNRIWKRRWTFSSTLYLINRYSTSLGYIPILYFSFSPPDSIQVSYLSLFTQIIIAITLSLRSYALYQKNNWVLLFTAALGLATIITSAWSLTKFFGILLSFSIGTGQANEFRTCVPAFINSDVAFIITFLLALSFDVAIFVLTVARTFQMVKWNDVRDENRSFTDLPRLLMRDGSLYFGVMVLANLINFILFLKTENTFFAQSTGNNCVLSHVISVTMISRLILNLHAYDDRRRKHQYQISTQLSTQISRYSSWIVRTADGFTMSADGTFSSNSDTITGTSLSISREESGLYDDEELPDDEDVYGTRRAFGPSDVYELRTLEPSRVAPIIPDLDVKRFTNGDIGSWPRYERR